MIKKWLLFLAALLVFAACEAGSDEEISDENDSEEIVCDVDEMEVNGECVTVEDKNVQLFERDLSAEVSGEDVNGEGFSGYFAEPIEEGQYPGVLMIHEWWGLNENIKYMADLLASEGYRVFAIDLYDGEVATESSRAGELAGSVRSNADVAVAKMSAALGFLKQQGSEKVASLGWCFGGGQSLNVSLAEPLDATVIYYGNLVEDQEQLANLNGPVLGIFGGQDNSIPVESVNTFDASLDSLGIENSINIYEGVGHAFANPSGGNYAPEATVDAWQKTVEFLEGVL